MSLNGLDEAPVIEAYQAAFAEAGGWFLLKYIARDAVDLLGRGTGGVPEVRNAVGKYEEKSPLYGLVQYRRRKVILKYVPEGTSRLLQARLAVQFQSVTEKFTPNDAIFTFATAGELTESALSSVCMLHASANSLTSSSSSLRRRRLGEITEAAEEGTPSMNEKRTDSRSMHLDVDESQRYGRGEPSPLAKTTTMDDITHEDIEDLSQSKTSDSPTFVIEQVQVEKLLPPPPNPEIAVADKEAKPETSRTSFAEPRPSYEPRRSSQSARPSAYDLDASSLYGGYGGYKKKVKLGPRPSVERPHTSGSQFRGYQPRPVSSLPAGVRPARTQSTANSRPVSRRSERSQIASQTRFQVTPEEYQNNPLPAPVNIQLASLYRPNLVEPASPASTIARSVASTTKASGVTPEKQRLMKALQLRKRQLAEKARQENLRLQEMQLQKSSTEAQAEDVPPEDVHDGAGDIIKEEDTSKDSRRELEHAHQRDTARVASPVSLPGTSDGPSTQSSNFTEEADRSTLDTQDHSSGPASSKTSLAEVSLHMESKEGVSEDSIKGDEASTETVTSPKLDVKSENSVESHEQALHTGPVDSPDGASGSETVVEAHLRSRIDPNLPVIAIGRTTEALPAIEEPERPHSLEYQSTEVGSDAGERRKKRPAALDSLKLVAPIQGSDPSDISDDESLMDDLDNASVHEARPIQVSRSPITPVFAKSMQSTPASHGAMTLRTVSNPLAVGKDKRSSSVTSTSALQERWPPKAEPAAGLTVKKVNVSSGISKRIKALEMFTARESSLSPTPSPTQTPNTSKSPLTSFRKRSSFIKSMTPNASTSSPPPNTAYPSPSPTPEPTSASKTFERPKVTSPSTSPHKKRESVSVTARIVRSSSELNRSLGGNSESAMALNLHRSPLIIERDDSDLSSQRSPLPETPQTESPEPSKREKRFSFSSTASFSKMSSSDLLSGRPSFSGRQRPSESNLPRSISETSSLDAADEHKESRTSRLRKRMSSLTSGSRRNKALSPKARDAGGRSPPTIHEAFEQDREPSIAEVVPHEVDIGDVNVQFPDTLLWKRRFMRIDDQGYIILTPPTMDSNNRNISKRYHLSEFRKPTLPDLDRQELPHSILLDFEDGNTLQCACESKYTQQQVLRMLVDAHSAYHQLYPQ